MTKRIRLTEMKTILGRSFRTVVRDEIGNPVIEVVRDEEGNPVYNTVPDQEGKPRQMLAQRNKSRELKPNEALPEQLRSFFLNMQEPTRQDIIYGTKMFQNLDKVQDGILEMDEDVHDWLKKKMQDEKVGPALLGVNLKIIEDALDNFERLHEGRDE